MAKFTLYHFHSPFLSATRDPDFYREQMYLDPDELDQRRVLDEQILKLTMDASIITNISGKTVRVERSLSEPESVFLNTNYRYTVTSDEIAAFVKATPAIFDLFMDFYLRIGIAHDSRFLDKLITRTYATLTNVPTETSSLRIAAHDEYPWFWVYPYARSRLHEILSVGIG